MIASFTCAIAFYGGRWVDGAISFLFGLFVYYLDYLCNTVRGLSHIEGFLATTVISFVAFILSTHVLSPLHISHCPYAQIFGAIVWLLPGITLSVSLLELYSSMIVYGASRLIYGIALAAQLGFGLGVGFYAANPGHPLPEDFTSGCLLTTSSPGVEFVLLLIASTAFSLICNAELKRLPGLCPLSLASSDSSSQDFS
jgi:uncharacterized membrane protein YjjB (DUF3815 family)